MECQYDGCGAQLTYRGTGRRPRFCVQHQKGAAAMRRLRSKGGANRPLCCVEAHPALKCEQHKEDGVEWTLRDHFADYSGALPRKKRTATLSNLSEFDVLSTMDSEAIAELQSLALPSSGMQFKGKSSATRKPPGGQWIREQFTDGSGAIPVIGQRDVDADWQPVGPAWRDNFGERIGSTGFKASAPVALLPRGDAWPWANASA